MTIRHETAAAIAARLAAGEKLLLVDIREPEEWAIAAIDGSEQRAMSRMREWWPELPTDREVVIFCHHGGRSMQVCQMLAMQAGLTNLTNMEGGIDGWSTTVDPSVRRY